MLLKGGAENIADAGPDGHLNRGFAQCKEERNR